MVQTQFSCKVKIVRSDNGLEFKMSEFFKQNGIVHQTSCVYTPQQNGGVEQKHQHLLNVARSLIFQVFLPLKFWGEVVLIVVYIINRIPTPPLHDKTPYEVLHSSPPPYDKLKVFGCLCYVSTHFHQRTKFSPKAKPSIFTGYSSGTKGYKVYDMET